MQRIQSFDLARGFTVLSMPAIHVVMLYSTPAVQQSVMGNVLAFIAEGPGAQLFMLLMGVSFSFSKRISKKYVLQRAFILAVAAYALNYLKFIIPLGLGFMPRELLNDLQLKNDFKSFSSLIFIGDILHFAAIAYIILYFVFCLPSYHYWSLILAAAVTFISPYTWDIQTGNTAIDYVLSLFGGHPPKIYFPVFPWLVYPLTGLSLGYLLKVHHKKSIMWYAGWSGVALIILSLTLPAAEPAAWLPFYRTGPADTLFHTGFILIWLAIFHWLTGKISVNPVFTLLTFCAKNITAIYIIQWILICWCLAFTGYLRLNMLSTLCWMTAITIFTLLLTHALNKTNAQPKNI